MRYDAGAGHTLEQIFDERPAARLLSPQLGRQMPTVAMLVELELVEHESLPTAGDAAGWVAKIARTVLASTTQPRGALDRGRVVVGNALLDGAEELACHAPQRSVSAHHEVGILVQPHRPRRVAHTPRDQDGSAGLVHLDPLQGPRVGRQPRLDMNRHHARAQLRRRARERGMSGEKDRRGARVLAASRHRTGADSTGAIDGRSQVDREIGPLQLAAAAQAKAAGRALGVGVAPTARGDGQDYVEYRSAPRHITYSATMNRLDDKVAIITGAAAGIGLAAAQLFSQAGAKVVLADIKDASASAAELGGTFVETDVTDAEAVERLVAVTVEQHQHLDIMVNNAGVELVAPLAATNLDKHRTVIDVNLNGTYYGLQFALRAMMNNPGPSRGAIVNTASVAGLTGCPGLSSYNAAKGGVVLLTKNAAVEYGQFGIRVNAVCPGMIRTDMVRSVYPDEAHLEAVGRKAHPLGRVGEPEDVARLIAFLASDDASFISGAIIPIDGAMTAGFPPPRLG